MRPRIDERAVTETLAASSSIDKPSGIIIIVVSDGCYKRFALNDETGEDAEKEESHEDAEVDEDAVA